MKKSLFWILALVITLASAFYQRRTGPTYPMAAKAVVAGSTFHFELPRSGDSTADEVIKLAVPPPAEAYLKYQRYKTDDPWARKEFVRQGGDLVGSLPKQPAAGKLAYEAFIVSEGREIPVTGGEPVVIRFKDPVPLGVLILHVLVMFSGMLASTAAGLAALDHSRNPKPFALWALGLIFAGGFIMGPLVQKFAFGVFWSGFPLGTDLTDTKTLLIFFLWVAAVIAGRKGKPARGVVLAASVVTLLVYLIPHSLLGSELKYTSAKKG
jgi:hypothetical protein